MIRKDYRDPLRDWAKVHNDWARDASISWEALGLLTYLTTHAEGFPLRIDDLYRQRIAGRKKVDRMIRELEGAGYLSREREVNRGTFGATIWHLQDPRSVDAAVDDR